MCDFGPCLDMVYMTLSGIVRCKFWLRIPEVSFPSTLYRKGSLFSGVALLSDHTAI